MFYPFPNKESLCLYNAPTSDAVTQTNRPEATRLQIALVRRTFRANIRREMNLNRKIR